MRQTYGRFLAPFYVAHLLLLCSYIPMRLSLSEYYTRVLNKADFLGLPREIQMYGSWLVLMAVRWLTSPTLDAWVSTGIFFGHFFSCMLISTFSSAYLVCYICLALSFYIALPQPIYKGPQKITYHTDASLREQVMGRRADGVAHLIIFYASWSPRCTQLSPLIADLSVKYSSASLQFSKVDVGRFSHVAETFQIDTNSLVHDPLPVLSLVKDGKEVLRFPTDQKLKMTSGNIVNFFRLGDLSTGAGANAATSSRNSKTTSRKGGKKSKKN